jgi:hypothetical protein
MPPQWQRGPKGRRSSHLDKKRCACQKVTRVSPLFHWVHCNRSDQVISEQVWEYLKTELQKYIFRWYSLTTPICRISLRRLQRTQSSVERKKNWLEREITGRLHRRSRTLVMLNDGSGTCLVSVDHVISYEDQKANMFADVYVKVGSD